MDWFHGKVLVVELHGMDAYSRELELSETHYKLLLGGRGLAVLVWSLLAGGDEPPEPLSSSNPLIIAPGALVGSGLSTASKTAFVARSPLTGLIGRAMSGGRIGWEIRRAGYDFLAIVGSLEKPGLLIIDKKGVRVVSGEDYWGLTVSKTRRILAERYKGYADAIIGPAGENLSSMAMIDTNGRQAGRTGLGAVLGAKKVKAVFVKGWIQAIPHDKNTTRRIAGELNRETHSHKASKALVEYGTPLMLDYTNKIHGVLPSLNWQKSTLSWCKDPQRAHYELSRFAEKLRVSRNPCIGCGRPCSQVVEIEDGRVDGPEYETIYALGSNIGLCNINAIAKLNLLADELGFDTISLGATIAWAIHAGETGILQGAPGWGDINAIEKLVLDMAYRRGTLGELLADGVRKAVEKLGDGEELAVHVKGLEPPAYDARGLKGMALGYAVSSRGADHLTSGAYAFELPGKLWVFKDIDRSTYKGKALLVKAGEDLMAFYDNTGICKFSRYTLYPDKISTFLKALTGIEYSPGELLRIGERTVTLERLVNLWLGLNPLRDDNLPSRFFDEPISDGPSKGMRISREEFENMRREYYLARGWNIHGLPTKYIVTLLDLQEIIPSTILNTASTVLDN